jgi:hypothetical protein
MTSDAHVDECVRIAKDKLLLLNQTATRANGVSLQTYRDDRGGYTAAVEVFHLALMCQADTTPLFVVRDPKSVWGEKADFNTQHRCRDFVKLQRWMEKSRQSRA